MSSITNSDIIALAIERAGGVSRLARALGIRYQSIQIWRRIPADRIVAIEGATGIPREQLRPDLYRRKQR